MALISRVSRLLRADLHAVLDHLEEPDVLLRQAVREMEEALARDAVHLKRLCQEHEHLARREQELQQVIGNIDDELDVCFEAAEHELARSLCRRKLETQQLLETITRRREWTNREHDVLEERYREQQIRFESMRQKAELLATESAKIDDDLAPQPGQHVPGDAVEVAFLREQHKRRAP
jgi:phage shock protein A